MDNGNDFVYFVNSQGKRAALSSPENRNYWELIGRTGFTAPDVDIFTEKYSSGAVKYYGRTLQPRVCSMNMVCVGDSTAERDKVFFEIVDILMDTEGNGQGTLYVKRSNGSTVHLNCVYSGGMNITEEYRHLHKFAIEFYAADPWFYGSEKVYRVNQIRDYQDGILTLDDVNPGAVGRFTLGPSVTWISLVGGYIVNNTTSKKFTFAGDSVNQVPFAPGNLLTFDFNPRDPQITALSSDGKISNGSKYFNIQNTDLDFGFVPGQNVIDFTNLGGTAYYDDYMKLYLQYRYLSA